MLKCCVLFEVRAELLNNIYTSFGFKGLIKFSVGATSGSSNVKPILNLLPHVVENFLIRVCTRLCDPCLELV
jgi:hypothetical protein